MREASCPVCPPPSKSVSLAQIVASMTSTGAGHRAIKPLEELDVNLAVALRSGAIKLVCRDFVLNGISADKIARRQDLEAHERASGTQVFLSPTEAKVLLRANDRSIAVLSYCWTTATRAVRRLEALVFVLLCTSREPTLALALALACMYRSRHVQHVPRCGARISTAPARGSRPGCVLGLRACAISMLGPSRCQ